MSEEHPTISSSRLSATEVARHNFGTVRRGFDPQEVRAYLELVARDMQTWEQREQELRQEMVELAERARNPVLDESTLTSALGQQSAQILRRAHEEAARVTAEAETRAAALVREAQSLAAESSVRAETAAAERIAEADLSVGTAREQARAEAQAIAEEARADADELAIKAREHGRRVVEEAQVARKRVLADLAHRRRSLHVQIDQLRAARDELTASVLGVRRAVDQIEADLASADERARSAASEAGQRSEVAAGLDTDEVLLADLDPGGLGSDEDAVEDGSDDAGVEIAGRADPDAVALSDTAAASGEEESERSGAEVGAGESVSTVRILADQVTEVVQVVPVESATEEPSAIGDEASVDSTALEELFARIRASQQTAASTAGEGDGGGSSVEPAGTNSVAAEPAATGSEPTTGQEPVLSGDQVLLARRDELLTGISTKLARRLKRALADDQNDLLDRLRANGGRWAADVLAPEEDHAAAMAAVAIEPLREAVAVGQELATELGATVVDRPRQVPVEGMAEELGLTVVRLLRRRLPGGEDGSAPDEVDDAADVVGAAYRSWRGQRIESLVGDHVLGALGAGAVAAGSGGPLRWVVGGGDDACADCDDNSLAEEVPAGAAFPTGHAHPPAHAGCRCLVVPASA